MKKVIICTYNYFTSKYQVGSHNYAKTFAKLGYMVAFISNPISPLHFIFANNDDLIKRNNIYKKDGIWDGNIWYYVPKSFFTPQNKPILSSRYIFNNWYKFTFKDILKKLKSNGFEEVDLLWIESPYFSFMLDVQKYKKSILRLADFSKGFEGSWNLTYEKEIEISKKVDKVIYTAKKLRQQYNKIENIKMHYIPNGIDLGILERSDKSTPKEFNYIRSPRVLYIGLIDYWFDIELLYKCSMKYPNYNFIIIGDVKVDVSKIDSLPNIYFLGSKLHSEISKYLSNSDIGIIPFKNSEFVDSINPIKLYEYAAFDLKIVLTKWKEIESFSNLFDVCDTEELFLEALSDIKVKNSKEIKYWLSNQSWESRIKKVLEDDFII